MSDAHAVARDQLLAFITRIERLESEKKTIADDIKDVYGEAKGTGFDTKILREVIKIRKQDRDERAEREAILDSYLIALGMIDQPSFFDDEPRESAPAARQPAMALRADGGLNILTKHEDIRTALETAEEIHANPEEVGARGETVSAPAVDAGSRPVAGRSATATSEVMDVTGGESAATGPKVLDGRSPVAGESRHRCDVSEDDAGQTLTGTPHSEKATVATQGEATAPTSDGNDDTCCVGQGEVNAAANAGGDHVDGGAARANHDENGEGAASALPARPKFVLRPYCRNPGETCGGSGTTHCHSCLKASEEVAA